MLDFINKAKWDAWKSLGSLSQVCQTFFFFSFFKVSSSFYSSPRNQPLFVFQGEAREQYVSLISSLTASEQPEREATQPGNEMSYQTLLVSTTDKITTITLNRPEKKNAITVEVR